MASRDESARDLDDRRRPAFRDRYALQRVIARGSTAMIYAAVDEVSHSAVAVKLPRTDVHVTDSKLQAFQLETVLTAKLDHPSIVRVIEHGLDDTGTPFMVMELLEGETLDQRLATGVIPERQALQWTIELADALSAAHAVGIVHCDLKPQNVVVVDVGGREIAKLLDFGIARWADDEAPDRGDESELPAPGPMRSVLAAGDAEWMPPEMNRAEAVKVQSDIYGLGCLLFAMVEGTPPFPSDGDPTAAILGHRSDAVPWATRCSRVTASLIRQMLRKDPEHRIETAPVLRRRVRDCLARI